MAEPWLSTVEKLTEFFSTDQIEASARRTKFVQRASKITGKLFLALVTFGRWSTAKTTVPQLAAKAAQLDSAGGHHAGSAAAADDGAGRGVFAGVAADGVCQAPHGDTICEEGIFAPFSRVHIADSTGFGLPESLAPGISRGGRQWQQSGRQDSTGVGVQESHLRSLRAHSLERPR